MQVFLYLSSIFTDNDKRNNNQQYIAWTKNEGMTTSGQKV